MKIYGYESDDSDLLSLSEVTLQTSLNDLKDLVSFIDYTIGLIEKSGDKFGHEHFSDYIEDKNRKFPDIIVTLMKE